MNYYFVMDDMANKTFHFGTPYGLFDFNILLDPFSDDEPSKPWDLIYEKSSPDTIYYNLVNKREYLKKIDFSYDFYESVAGYIVSEKLFTLFESFHIPPYVYKKIKFMVNGNLIKSPNFYLFSFQMWRYDKTVPRDDFINYNQTELLPSKTKNIVTKKLVLKDNVRFDMFEFGNVELLLSSGFVVSEKVKNAIENNNCGKGIRFLPIETAQVEFCKRTFKDFNDLIKKPKPRLP